MDCLVCSRMLEFVLGTIRGYSTPILTLVFEVLMYISVCLDDIVVIFVTPVIVVVSVTLVCLLQSFCVAFQFFLSLFSIVVDQIVYHNILLSLYTSDWV